MLLARQGHRVVLVDRATFPSDTISTHAVARGGVVQLARWGLLDAVLASGAPAIRRVRFHVGGEVIDRAIKERAQASTSWSRPAATSSTTSWSRPPERPGRRCARA